MPRHLAPESERALPDVFFKHLAEMRIGIVAAEMGHIRNRMVGLNQQLARFIDTYFLQMLRKLLLCPRFEKPAKRRLGHAGDLCHLIQCDLPMEVSGHKFQYLD